MATLSKTQVDRLGDRLKDGPHTDGDLQLLDEYRLSFRDAYAFVFQKISKLGLSPSGRTAKSGKSIVEKLRREKIRLTQMQDIAGCRVVVKNILEQDKVVASLGTVFPGASIKDRRAEPSCGYRAVHVIATVSAKPVEIQVRTTLQDSWAELSEKSSDVIDPAMKYGGGPDEWRVLLTELSDVVRNFENDERTCLDYEDAHAVSEKLLADLIAREASDREIEEKRRRCKELARMKEDSRRTVDLLRKKIEPFLRAATSILSKRHKQ
jgi:ppGpp synthetase/RelA/SpoT-type nucleotidyltranferase